MVACMHMLSHIAFVYAHTITYSEKEKNGQAAISQISQMSYVLLHLLMYVSAQGRSCACADNMCMLSHRVRGGV